MSLESKIESLLFISAKPMSVKEIADLTSKNVKEIKSACDELIKKSEDEKKGIRIIRNNNKYQMTSSPDNAKVVQDFIRDETTGELSRPSLEALTIIAYRGPISKIDIDRIRGVNCSLILRNLILRGLVESSFNKVKNETYYNITLDFIRFLGINKIEELPDYNRLNKDDTLDKMLDNMPKETN